MSHVPLNPNETIPPHMHGFDPLPTRDAVNLTEAFTRKMSDLNLNAAQASFYFDAATLTDLLQAQRNQCTYDGFIFLFGLDANDQLTTLIHRVNADVTDCKIDGYTNVEQSAYVENPNTKEIELIEYAVMPVNKNGFARLYRIDVDSNKFDTIVEKFAAIFKDDNQEKVYKIKAKRFLSQLAEPSGAVVRTKFLTVGYYIGWGILDLIRRELNSKVGIKLFFGYGTYSLNISSAFCVHLVAIAADHPDAQLNDYPLPTVWSTQDQSKPEEYILDDINESILATTYETAFQVGTLGTSCTFAIKVRNERYI